MPYEYDDEGGTYWVPEPSEHDRKEDTCIKCGQPGTVIAPWYNDETHPDWDTFKHNDPTLDNPEACTIMARVTQGARV